MIGTTVIVVMTAAWMAIIGNRSGGDPTPFIEHVFYVAPFWYLWALFALPVISLAKNRPIERGVLISRSVMHLGLALMLSLTHTTLRFVFQTAIGADLHRGAEDVSSADLLIALATLEAPVHLLIYGAILGVTFIASFQRRLRERELATTQLRTQLALAQVQALRMQINPHFLFNAMNSISMLVRDRKQEAAVKTIAGLSDLLRYVLDDSSDQEVPLRRELDFVKRYLAIEQIRFQDRLQVSIEPSDGTLDALVPNLLLQPIVENAIRHGISRSAAATKIVITSATRDEALVLRVLDDGPGFTNDPPRRSSSGLGIANTRKRLAQLYADNHSLDLDSQDPHGAVVCISLPFHTTPVFEGNDAP